MAVKFQAGRAAVLKNTGGKKKTPNDKVRRAYYQITDGRWAMETALTELGDQQALQAFRKLVQAIDDLNKTLDRNWLWD